MVAVVRIILLLYDEPHLIPIDDQTRWTHSATSKVPEEKCSLSKGTDSAEGPRRILNSNTYAVSLSNQAHCQATQNAIRACRGIISHPELESRLEYPEHELAR
jgi:hypothetical protein